MSEPRITYLKSLAERPAGGGPHVMVIPTDRSTQSFERQGSGCTIKWPRHVWWRCEAMAIETAARLGISQIYILWPSDLPPRSKLGEI